MKTSFLLLVIITQVSCSFFEFVNLYFIATITNDKLNLNDGNNNINIIINNNNYNNYNIILDENDRINDEMFLDDNYYYNYMNPHSYNRVKFINNNLNITYEMKYDVYDITNIDKNYFDVNINSNINESIILIFDESYYYNGFNIIQIKNYIIYFEESNLINLERFGQYFYIHLNDIKSTYNFIIKYNNDKLSS